MGPVDWKNLIEHLDFQMIFKGSVLFIIGLIVASVISRLIGRTIAGKISKHHQLLIRKLVYYVLVLAFTLTALGQMGFETDALVALAGILTVAVGFASQNASSNLVSGLFLIGERPFAVGDRIKFMDREGEVVNIDLLSVKVRLYDNTLYRIPNELLLRTPVVNLTRYPIRRLDCMFNFAQNQDIHAIERIALESARDPKILTDPPPRFIIKKMQPYGLECVVCMWLTRDDFYPEKTRCYQLVIKGLTDAGVKFTESVVAGSAAG